MRTSWDARCIYSSIHAYNLDQYCKRLCCLVAQPGLEDAASWPISNIPWTRDADYHSPDRFEDILKWTTGGHALTVIKHIHRNNSCAREGYMAPAYGIIIQKICRTFPLFKEHERRSVSGPNIMDKVSSIQSRQNRCWGKRDLNWTCIPSTDPIHSSSPE